MLGNGLPLESSDESIEALRDEELLSPLILDHSKSHAFGSLASVFPQYRMPLSGRLTNSQAPGGFIHHPRVHHITSIHPKDRQGCNQRNRFQQFSSQGQSDWLMPAVINKKPLSDFLNDITPNRSQPVSHPPMQTKIIPGLSTVPASPPNKSPLVEDGTDMSGCLVCDKCLPGGRVTTVPLMDSVDFTEIPPRDRNFMKHQASKKTGHYSLSSWFGSKRKPCSAISSKLQPTQTQSTDQERDAFNAISVKESTGQDSKDIDIKNMEMAVGYLKSEISQANKKRDAALRQVRELKMAIEEMGKKMEYLVEYCQNIKVVVEKPSRNMGEYSNPERENMLQSLNPFPGSAGSVGCTKKEFYQAVTEARIGVKQFCKTLLQQIQEQSAVEKIESILEPYKVRLAPRVSKCVRYHIESLINQAFFEDFENIRFQRSGTNYVLDPLQRPQAFYRTYLSMLDIEWSELVSKESSTHSENFDVFCDLKMNAVEEILNWDGGWPDELARAFFVAAKWVWLLHLLAFSFEHAAMIFRVGPRALFEPYYMQELSVDQSAKLKSGATGEEAHVRIMVMPGFFLTSSDIIKCKVILSQEPISPN